MLAIWALVPHSGVSPVAAQIEEIEANLKGFGEEPEKTPEPIKKPAYPAYHGSAPRR